MKIIMAIVVIAIHTKPFENVDCQSRWVTCLYNSICDVAVPFFFIASGFLVFDKIISLPEKMKSIIIKNYAIKILKLYITWTIIYLPITMYDYMTNGKEILRNFFAFIKGFLFVGCHWNSWPLWYLLSVFYSFCFIYVCLFKWNLSKKMITLISCVIYVGANTFTLLVDRNNEITGALHTIINIGALLFENGRIFTGFFYIVMGWMIAELKKTTYKERYKFLIFVFFIFSFIGKCSFEGIIERCLLAIFSICIFGLILSCEVKNTIFLKKCRNLSTKLFLLHMIVYTCFDIIVLRDRYAFGMKCFVVTVTVTLILSLLAMKYEEGAFVNPQT